MWVAASTGPHSGECGELPGVPERARSPARSFNGAALRRVRRANNASHRIEGFARFNGAALRRVRRAKRP